MINLLALALVVSSITASSFFSTFPDDDHQVLREGHRLIVVEFERQIPQSAGEIDAKANENAAEGLAQPSKGKPSSILTDSDKNSDQFQESASNALKSVADQIKQNAAQIEESVSDAVKSTAQDVRQKASTIDESASFALRNAAKATKKKIIGLHRSLTGIFRRGWDRAGDAEAFVVAAAVEAARSGAKVVHLLGFATAYGTCVWVTFVSNHVLAAVLPRQQLGIVQSRIYPVYFRFLAAAVGVGLVGHVLSGQDRVQGFNLMAVLAIVLLNLVWLEPKATKVMFERMKLEKEEGRASDVTEFSADPAKPGAWTAAAIPVAEALNTRKESAKGRASELKKRLKNLNSCSSFLNVLALMGLSCHLVYLA